MVRSTTLLAAALISAVNAKLYKFGVMTDIHLQPGYRSNYSADQYCMDADENVEAD